MDIALTQIETIFDRVVLGVERIAVCLEQLLQRPSDGRDGGGAGVDARILAQLFRDPNLPGLLASVARLAQRLRRLGCDVPVVPQRIVEGGPPIPHELWPFAESPPRWLPPPWLRGFLDPTTPALCRDVMAELLAARSESTPCWDVGTPTPRVQRARAAALLRTAATAWRVDGDASGAAWWTKSWHPARSPRQESPPNVFDWFVRTLHRELHEGPSGSRLPSVSDKEPILDEEPKRDAARSPRRRLARMPEKTGAGGRDRKRRSR